MKMKTNQRENKNAFLPGGEVFNALRDKECIVLACNARIIPGVAKGILRAAKDNDAVIVFELARTECNQHKGYTGLTPATYSKFLQEANKEVQHDIWVLHADHIQIREGTPEELDDVKELIKHQIEAGYTSFAIDASHLFNFEGKTIEEELAPNLKATIEIAKFIQQNAGSNFGLEVEVGEIGRKDSKGMVLTTPEEATGYIKKLEEAGVSPNLLAIANGSTHGNIYDKDGNLTSQVTIDIERTKAIAKALRDAGFRARIAQHGITGTSLDLIRSEFPKGDILKGNVATLFQNIAFEAIKKHNEDLYKRMVKWTLEKKSIKGKTANEIFGKRGKYAIKEFFNEIYSMSNECKKEIEERAYKEATAFIKAFNSEGTASIVRKKLKF